MAERRTFTRRDRVEKGRDNHFEHGDHSHDESEWYDGICSECGEAFRVPFKPEPGRSLLCRKCLRAAREARGEDTHRDSRPFGARRDRDARPATRERKTYEITCSHCGKRDMVPLPFKPFEGSIVLCRECQKNPNIERVGGKIEHTIICAACGKENKVPFLPDPGSRVLCRECHMAERAEKQRAQDYYAKHHPNLANDTRNRIEIRCDKCGAIDVLPFLPKTHGPILCRQCAENTFGDEWARRNRVAAREYPFTCARCAAQDFVPFKPKPGQELLCKHCLNDEAILTHKRSEMQRHDRFTCVRTAKKNSETPDNDKT